MNNLKGTSSIFILYLRSILRIKWHWFNFIFPILCSIAISLLLNCTTLTYDKFVEAQKNIVTNCLSFNGAVLGFVIAAFSIFASVGDRSLIVFAITNKRDGDYYSFHKTKLLTFFKSFYWLYIACISSFVYLLLLTVVQTTEMFGYKIYLRTFFIPNLFFFFAQIKVFIELKVLIFTIYNSSLMQAKYMAQDENLKPIDESND